MHVFAIGGGDIATGETSAIDAEVIRATGKDRPNVLFVPTASGDSHDYVQSFRAQFGNRLGAQTRELLLWSTSDFAEALEWADAVYVGGGHTVRMVARWREIGFDRALRTRADQGLVLSGLSAGANCWFHEFNTDSPMLDGAPEGTTAMELGLGWLDYVVCPHYTAEPYRRPAFEGHMASRLRTGIALDDGAAIEVVDKTFRILSSLPEAGATLYRPGSVERLEAFTEFRDLSTL